MYYKKIQILIFINICISICWWKFFLIQHLTHKICNLIFACCNARSQYLHNCLTTPPFRPSCFTQHPAAQPHPLSFAWEILPWFYLLLSSPSIKSSLSWSQEPQSSPMTLRRGNSRAAPKWEAAGVSSAGVTPGFAWLSWDYQGCCQPRAGPPHGSHAQFSNCSLVTARQSLESQNPPPLSPKALPVRKCHLCCPTAPDFSCSPTKTFLLCFFSACRGNGCHSQGCAALM